MNLITIMKIKYDIKLILLFTYTDSSVYKIGIKLFMKILVRIKKYLILVIILLSQNIMMIQTH